MKKGLLLLGLVAFLASSCSKDYTCSCKGVSGKEDITFEDAKKKDAQDACDALSLIWTFDGGSCELK
jgi:hypothetical protein